MRLLPRLALIAGRVAAGALASLAATAALTTSRPASASVLPFEVFDSTLGAPYNDPGVPPTRPGYGYTEGYRVPEDYGDNVTSTEVFVGPDRVYQYGIGAEGSTLNVSASYGPFSIFTGGPELFRGGYGDLNGVMYQGSRFPPPPDPAIGNDYSNLDIVLAADPGYDVLLYGFDLGGYQDNYTINAVTVYDGVPNALFTPTNQAFEELNVLVEGASQTSHTTFDETRFATSGSIMHAGGGPIQSHLIWIRIDSSNLGALSENIGIDNIRFGQVYTGNMDLPIDPGAIDDALQPPLAGAVPEAASAIVWLVGGGAAALVSVRRRRPS